LAMEKGHKAGLEGLDEEKLASTSPIWQWRKATRLV